MIMLLPVPILSGWFLELLELAAPAFLKAFSSQSRRLSCGFSSINLISFPAVTDFSAFVGVVTNEPQVL